MIFTEFGSPFVLRSDNGPCYSSREFQQFLEFYQIHHTTSSPHHPQSSGFAEGLVGISKKLMEKSIKDGKPWNYGLLQYKVTPISSTIPSPLEALTGMRSEDFTSPDPFQHWEVCGEFQDLTRNSSNINLQVLPPANNMELKPGQPVFMKEVHGNIWKIGVIDQPAKEPDSYWIKFPDISILRRTCSDDQTQIITFSFRVGSCRAKEWNNSQFISFKCVKEFPNKAPRTLSNQPYQQAIWLHQHLQ